MPDPVFFEALLNRPDLLDLHNAMAEPAAAFDLRCFAYLSMPVIYLHDR